MWKWRPRMSCWSRETVPELLGWCLVSLNDDLFSRLSEHGVCDRDIFKHVLRLTYIRNPCNRFKSSWWHYLDFNLLCPWTPWCLHEIPGLLIVISHLKLRYCKWGNYLLSVYLFGVPRCSSLVKKCFISVIFVPWKLFWHIKLLAVRNSSLA